MSDHDHPASAIDARFEHAIYSPRGTIEGALLQVDGAAAQVVCDPHDDQQGQVFASLPAGQHIQLRARPEPASPKGEAQHPVYRFEALLSVGGKKPARAKPGAADDPAAFSGVVARLNFARHGEPNGVVLDSGDFIHTRPDGMRQLGLAVGDKVVARGDAQPLAHGSGQVVEASEVNGRPVARHAVAKKAAAKKAAAKKAPAKKALGQPPR
jgi:hypothetical protein